MVWAHSRFTPGLLMLFTISPCALASGELALTKVMKQHEKNVQLIAGAISREDYEEVVKTALLVADPVRPPSSMAEKLSLMNFLGSNIARFKVLDSDSKERAIALAKAARTRNGEATIVAFQHMQLSCLTCHTEFRKSFQDHFSTRD